MTVTRAVVRASSYYDSVTLMRLQQALTRLEGIEAAGAVMGTPTNKDLLRQSGLLAPEAAAAGPDDLVVVVRATDPARAEAALAALDSLLERSRARPAGPGAYAPRSIRTAVRLLPGANLALVSVAGRFARTVCDQALGAGLHLFVFSDNVPLEDEVALKDAAIARGRLVMGPDCGTALLGGVALGFTNAVRRGPVGLVGAAGTGLQEVSCLLHRLGTGVSHAIGAGGRDLSAAVGARTMLQGLAALQADPATAAVVLVSKPPDPEVATKVLAAAAGGPKPVIAAFVGAGTGAAAGASGAAVPVVGTLEAAARQAAGLVAQLGWPLDSPEELVEPSLPPAVGCPDRGRRYVRGLFAGGTLAAEALALLSASLGEVRSNLGGGSPPLPEAERGRGHVVLDLGADEFTAGRLHPMLDPELRNRRLVEEARDPEVAVILFDVVLGYGTHPDPAGAMLPAIAEARTAAGGRPPVFVASVCGTDQDPQPRAEQVAKLRDAGVLVAPTNAAAARLAARLAGGAVPDSGDDHPAPGRHGRGAGAASTARAGAHPDLLRLLGEPLRVINVGLESFADSLKSQGVEVVHVAWSPPAGGNLRLAELLTRLETDRRPVGTDGQDG